MIFRLTLFFILFWACKPKEQNLKSVVALTEGEKIADISYPTFSAISRWMAKFKLTNTENDDYNLNLNDFISVLAKKDIKLLESFLFVLNDEIKRVKAFQNLFSEIKKNSQNQNLIRYLISWLIKQEAEDVLDIILSVIYKQRYEPTFRNIESTLASKKDIYRFTGYCNPDNTNPDICKMPNSLFASFLRDHINLEVKDENGNSIFVKFLKDILIEFKNMVDINESFDNFEDIVKNRDLQREKRLFADALQDKYLFDGDKLRQNYDDIENNLEKIKKDLNYIAQIILKSIKKEEITNYDFKEISGPIAAFAHFLYLSANTETENNNYYELKKCDYRYPKMCYSNAQELSLTLMKDKKCKLDLKSSNILSAIFNYFHCMIDTNIKENQNTSDYNPSSIKAKLWDGYKSKNKSQNQINEERKNVKEIQNEIRKNAIEILVDGFYGYKTQNAFKEVYRDKTGYSKSGKKITYEDFNKIKSTNNYSYKDEKTDDSYENKKPNGKCNYDVHLVKGNSLNCASKSWLALISVGEFGESKYGYQNYNQIYNFYKFDPKDFAYVRRNSCLNKYHMEAGISNGRVIPSKVKKYSFRGHPNACPKFGSICSSAAGRWQIVGSKACTWKWSSESKGIKNMYPKSQVIVAVKLMDYRSIPHSKPMSQSECYTTIMNVPRNWNELSRSQRLKLCKKSNSGSTISTRYGCEWSSAPFNPYGQGRGIKEANTICKYYAKSMGEL